MKRERGKGEARGYAQHLKVCRKLSWSGIAELLEKLLNEILIAASRMAPFTR